LFVAGFSVKRKSGQWFSWGGQVHSIGRCKEGVVFKNFRPLGEGFSVLASKPLTKVFFEKSCTLLFFFGPENAGIGYPVAV